MFLSARRWLPKAIILLSSLGSIGYPATALAQDRPNDTGGNVGPIVLPIAQGMVVEPALQRRLGLVTVDGGCSGTLLNRYWVLTARHCVTANGATNGPLSAPDAVRITAVWAPGQIGIVSRIADIGGGGPDIVLLYLGIADLGQVDGQPIHGRLIATDSVTQFGRGFSTFATGVYGGTPPPVAASGLGTYRSALLRPSRISAGGYTLVMNDSGQVGHGGDSGGPSMVTVRGMSVGIAGVQSTCDPTGYLPNAPEEWRWATGIESCRYVSTERFATDIRNAIRETPHCQDDPACAIPAIVSAAMRTAP